MLSGSGWYSLASRRFLLFVVCVGSVSGKVPKLQFDIRVYLFLLNMSYEVRHSDREVFLFKRLTVFRHGIMTFSRRFLSRNVLSKSLA